MKYLVTGAAGFIGSHLCETLVAGGDQVWGLDDLSKGSMENLEQLKGNPLFQFVKGSLSEEHLLSDLIAKADVIYHLAAVVGVKLYVEDPIKVIDVDVCQTARLMEFAWQMGKKVIFTSTSEVYGKSKELPFKEEGDRLYGPSTTDRWCYAVAKTAAEHLGVGYARKGLPVVIIRYFNVYGPRADSSDYGGVTSRFINQAFNNQPLTVHGDGGQTRCFTYIEDIIQGTLKAGSLPQAEGKILNLGTSIENSILELAHLVLKVSGSSAGFIFQPHADFYGPHYEDIPRRVPDLSSAEQLLEYRPVISLEYGLRHTIAWYRSRANRH